MLKVFIVLATLCSAGASACNGGKCNIEDEVSLMQMQNAITPGSDRTPPEEKDLSKKPTKLSEEGVKTEAFTLEEFGFPATPLGCEDRGCQGEGPNCGGNSFDCTSHGWIVTGWHHTCNGETKCESGYKVRCASCPAGNAAVSVPMPVLPSAEAVWVAPTETTTIAPTTETTTTFVFPTDAPSYLAAKFDKHAVNKSKHHLLTAKKNLTHFKKAAANASAHEKKVHANITKFEKEEQKARKEHEDQRDAAVRFAQKVELANQTIFKAKKAMADAYFAEKGAEEAAKRKEQEADNYNHMHRHAEKEEVDKENAVKKAKEALEIGETAVEKAKSELARLKKAAKTHYEHEKKHEELQQDFAEKMQKEAKEDAVRHAAREAFIHSSEGRNHHNVPPMDLAGESV